MCVSGACFADIDAEDMCGNTMYWLANAELSIETAGHIMVKQPFPKLKQSPDSLDDVIAMFSCPS